MATFQVGGLDAVKDFFGQWPQSRDGIVHGDNYVGREDGLESRQLEQSQAKLKRQSSRRSGVGATGKSTVEEGNRGDLTNDDAKRILRVGRKRARDGEADDDDDDEGDAGGDDENEGGRSSAVSDKKKFTKLLENAPVMEVKSRRRKKKKTQKSAKTKEQEHTTPATATETLGESTVETLHSIAVVDMHDSRSSVASGEDESKVDANKKRTTTKPRRKKVRSRQKNVRKDHRALRNRPAHLIPGRSEFSGRPLTPETRKRLGMADSRTAQWKQSLGGGRGDEAFSTVSGVAETS